MKTLLKAFAAILLAGTSATALATGGPPLVTDDPGTPGNRNLEMNVAFTSEISSSERKFETPIVDLNYGLGEQIQLKYEVPFVVSKKEDSSSESGFDRSELGVKWRFLEKEKAGFAMSAYPQLAFKSPVSESMRNQNAENSREVFLPFELEESRENWDFNQEVGYRVLNSSVNNQVAYGMATTYNIKDGLAVLGELHGNAFQDFRDHNLLVNLGGIIGLTKKVSLLVSAGSSLKNFQGEENPFVSYAGVQFRL